MSTAPQVPWTHEDCQIWSHLTQRWALWLWRIGFGRPEHTGFIAAANFQPSGAP
jgi:hypothetical protein